MPARSKSRIHRKAINTSGHAHELTFSCYQRFAFLKAERTCQWLADAIHAARVKQSFDLWAFVFMPEHVHLIVRPRQLNYAMPKIMAGIKLPVARRAIHFLEAENSPWLARITRQRGKHKERLFWQYGGGYDRNVTSGKTLQVPVPDVTGKPPDEARSMLEGAGLALGALNGPDAGERVVASSDPAPLAAVAKGTAVALTLEAVGVPVPTLVGLSWGKAKKTLE